MNRELTHFAVLAWSRRLGFDHYTRCTCVHEHLTPRVIRLVIATAHLAARVLALSRSFRFRARQVARHTPRTSGLFLDQTLLTALAAHRGARGRFYVETHVLVFIRILFIMQHPRVQRRGGLIHIFRDYSLIIDIYTMQLPVA